MHYKLLVITDPEVAVGFRLAGIDVEEVATPQEAESVLLKVIAGSNYGLIAINEEFQNSFSKSVKKVVDETDVPMVISFPAEAANVWRVEDKTDYVAALIRSSIGYHIKLSQ